MSLTSSRLSRRAVTGLPLAALLGLAACSTGESGASGASDAGGADADGSSAPALLPAAEGATQYPLTVTTWLGESVLEQRPTRKTPPSDSPRISMCSRLSA